MLAIARSFLYAFKYRFLHVIKPRSGVNTEPRDFKLAVSMTSYPARINSVFLALETLLNQTLKPDRLLLWLSRAEINSANLPPRLLALQAHGVEIKWVDENIKSYKKLVYTMDAFADHHMVTCDDDVFFPKWFLQRLYDMNQKHPDCIATYRCRVMRKISRRQLTPYIQWPLATKRTPIHGLPGYNLFPNGGCGTWYPPNSLHKQTSDRLFMQLAPTGDDIWFKAMSLLAKTKVVAVKGCRMEFPFIYADQAQAETLWQTNLDKNDAQLAAVFERFDLYDYIA